jgi:hypothetical protein
MLAVKFSAAFAHSHSEEDDSDDCPCDVYSDKFGLQYWLDADDSGNHNKGDVYQIVYGAAR